MSSDSGHWYTKDGKAAHFVPNVSGGGLRPTKITDARKLGLLPSVTGIIGVLDKPQLTAWLKRQVALHAFLYPPKPMETDEAYAKRVIDLAEQQVGDAADLGSRIHKSLETAFTSEWAGEYREYIEPVREWARNEGLRPISQEKVCVSLHHGYAGTMDLSASHPEKRIIVLDFKTKKTKKGEKIPEIPAQPMQLAAYSDVEFGTPSTWAANIYISTTEVGRFDVRWYSPEEQQKAFQAFLAAASLWRYLKGYDPR